MNWIAFLKTRIIFLIPLIWFMMTNKQPALFKPSDNRCRHRNPAERLKFFPGQSTIHRRTFGINLTFLSYHNFLFFSMPRGKKKFVDKAHDPVL